MPRFMKYGAAATRREFASMRTVIDRCGPGTGHQDALIAPRKKPFFARETFLRLKVLAHSDLLGD